MSNSHVTTEVPMQKKGNKHNFEAHGGYQTGTQMVGV